MTRLDAEVKVIVFEVFFHWSARVAVAVTDSAECLDCPEPGDPQRCPCAQRAGDAYDLARWLGAFEAPLDM